MFESRNKAARTTRHYKAIKSEFGVKPSASWIDAEEFGNFCRLNGQVFAKRYRWWRFQGARWTFVEFIGLRVVTGLFGKTGLV